MTTPNEYTRTSLGNIAAAATRSLTELDLLLPHMRAVANSLTGHRGKVARMALERAEKAQVAMTQADLDAEAAKTLFRSATFADFSAPPMTATPVVHTPGCLCPPPLV
jgi:hypothetical protein